MSKKKNIIGNWYTYEDGICKVLRKNNDEFKEYGDLVVLNFSLTCGEATIETHLKFAEEFNDEFSEYTLITPIKAKSRLIKTISGLKELFNA